MDKVGVIDPLADGDYDEWLLEQPGATIFHTSKWARVLAESYGHRPCYLTLGPKPGRAVLPLMEVASALTGRRGVSLPFTDFCSAAGSPGGGMENKALALGRDWGWRYMEFRGGESPGAMQPSTGGNAPAKPRASVAFWAHEVIVKACSTQPALNFSPAVLRAVRKAERSGLSTTISTDAGAMRQYFTLHCATRKRHGLPPQPWRFFDSISRNLVETGDGFVTLCKLGESAVAGAVFLTFGGMGIYKFGASLASAQALRPNNLVMREGFKACAERGCERVHLGRTSLGNEGLRRFKLGFGAQESTLEYHRYDYRRDAYVRTPDRAKPGWINHVFRALPIPCLRLAGSALYPHLS